MLFPRYIFLQDFRNLTRKDSDIRIKNGKIYKTLFKFQHDLQIMYFFILTIKISFFFLQYAP